MKEGQQVAKGQKIAEMGNTDADQVKLHFEIRRLGKPVDPASIFRRHEASRVPRARLRASSCRIRADDATADGAGAATSRRRAPEPDRCTRELPLRRARRRAFGADFVNDVTQIYLNEIGQHALLTADEELALARAMRGRRLRRAADD